MFVNSRLVSLLVVSFVVLAMFRESVPLSVVERDGSGRWASPRPSDAIPQNEAGEDWIVFLHDSSSSGSEAGKTFMTTSGSNSDRLSTTSRVMTLDALQSHRDACPRVAMVVELKQETGERLLGVECRLPAEAAEVWRKVRSACPCCPLLALLHQEDDGVDCTPSQGWSLVAAALSSHPAPFTVLHIGSLVGVSLWEARASSRPLEPNNVLERWVYGALVHGSFTVRTPDHTQCFTLIDSLPDAVSYALKLQPFVGTNVHHPPLSSLWSERFQWCSVHLSHGKVASEIAFLTAARPEFLAAPEEPILDVHNLAKIRSVTEKLKAKLPSAPPSSRLEEDQRRGGQTNASVFLNSILKSYIVRGATLIERVTTSFSSSSSSGRVTPSQKISPQSTCRACGHSPIQMNVLHFGPRCSEGKGDDRYLPRSSTAVAGPSCQHFHRCPICGYVQSANETVSSSRSSTLSSSSSSSSSSSTREAHSLLTSMGGSLGQDWCSSHMRLLRELWQRERNSSRGVTGSSSKSTTSGSSSSSGRVMGGDWSSSTTGISLPPLHVTLVDPEDSSTTTTTCNVPLSPHFAVDVAVERRSVVGSAQPSLAGSVEVVVLPSPFRLHEHERFVQQRLRTQQQSKQAQRAVHVVIPCPLELSTMRDKMREGLHPSAADGGFPSDEIFVTSSTFVTVKMIELLAEKLTLQLSSALPFVWVRDSVCAECLVSLLTSLPPSTRAANKKFQHRLPSAEKAAVGWSLVSEELVVAASMSLSSSTTPPLHPSLLLTQPHQAALQQARIDHEERWREQLLEAAQEGGIALFGVGRSILDYLQLHHRSCEVNDGPNEVASASRLCRESSKVPRLRFIVDLALGAGRDAQLSAKETGPVIAMVSRREFLATWVKETCGRPAPWTAVVGTHYERLILDALLHERPNELDEALEKTLRRCHPAKYVHRVLVLFPKPLLIPYAGRAAEGRTMSPKTAGSRYEQPFRFFPVVPLPVTKIEPHLGTMPKATKENLGQGAEDWKDEAVRQQHSWYSLFEELLHSVGSSRLAFLQHIIAANNSTNSDRPLSLLAAASAYLVANPRRRIVLVTHVLNEEHFLPFWITHHAPLFDKVVFIDYNSTDRTREVLDHYAPSSWEIAAYPRPASFRAVENDRDVVREENRFPGWWKLSITATEHLVAPFLRARMRDQTYRCLRVPSYAVAGVDPVDEDHEASPHDEKNRCGRGAAEGVRRWVPLALQRTRTVTWTPRMIHSFGSGHSHRYRPGRHSSNIPECIRRRIPMFSLGTIWKFSFSPWPELQIRKEILKQMTNGVGAGAEHHQRSWQQWIDEREKNRKRDEFVSEQRMGLSVLDMNSRTHYVHRDSWQNEFLLAWNLTKPRC